MILYQNHLKLGFFLMTVFQETAISYIEFGILKKDKEFENEKDQYQWTFYAGISGSEHNTTKLIEWFEEKNHKIKIYKLNKEYLEFNQKQFTYQEFLDYIELNVPELKEQEFLEHLYHNLPHNDDDWMSYSNLHKFSIGDDITKFWGNEVKSIYLKNHFENKIFQHDLIFENSNGVTKI
jgi:hypothetical protein